MAETNPSNTKRKGVEDSEVESGSSAHTTSKKRKTSKTVCFNVGGTHYEISHSLLNQHPNCMLARMVSEEWSSNSIEDKNSNNRDNAAQPLFIERDGFRFRYVLDYMRDGEVSLPPNTASKDAVLKELFYFGFDQVPEEAIAISRDTVDMVNRFVSMEDMFKNMMRTSEDITDQMDQEMAELTSRHKEETSDLNRRHTEEASELNQRHQFEELELIDRQERELEWRKREIDEEMDKQNGLINAFNIFQHYRQFGKVDGVVYLGLPPTCPHYPCYHAFVWYKCCDFPSAKQHFHESLAKFGLQIVEYNFHQGTITYKIAHI